MTSLQLAALTLIKISGMLFYRRIFLDKHGVGRTFDRLTIIVTVVTLLWGIAFFFAFVFACHTNFEYAWLSLADQRMCPANFVGIDQGLSVSDLFLDLVVLLFPVPLVWLSQLFDTLDTVLILTWLDLAHWQPVT